MIPVYEHEFAKMVNFAIRHELDIIEVATNQ